MTAPRFYTWDDDGSPGRALSGNLQNRLKQILVPCLVTGYGDKPGAGWTLEHEHANGFTLSNGDAYVNFVSNLPAQTPLPAMSTTSIHIYVAESLTDTSQAIVGGVNLCSGSYRFGSPELANYPRHFFGRVGDILSAQLSNLIWTLVADGKTFVLNCSSEFSKFYDLNASFYSFSLYSGQGKLDVGALGDFLVLGGDVGAYNSNTSMYAFSRGYTTPRDPATGLAGHSIVESEPYAYSSVINSSADTTPPARLNFQQPRLLSNGKFAGLLRGVVYDDILRSKYGWGVSLKALGFSGTDFTDRGKPVKIGDYSYAFARSYSGNSFLTDNPAFW